MTNRKMQYWVIPPEADAEFVANMEDVLETYAKPYAPKVPVLCVLSASVHEKFFLSRYRGCLSVIFGGQQCVAFDLAKCRRD